MRKPTGKALAAIAAALLVIVGVLVVPGLLKESEGEGGEESLSEFARERAAIQGRRLPLAVVREKLEKGKEAGGEIASGPSQQQVDQRAFPRAYVETKRALAARSAYRSAPSRLGDGAFKASAPERAQRAALAADWTELGPVIPNVPGDVTYTGSPTTNSGRVTALAIDPNCGSPGKGCRLWVAAAGGGIFRTADALAATVQWTSSSDGLTSNAIGSIISDPTDPSGDTLYVGTGEPNGSSDSEAGVGLFKSTDGGVSWILVPGSEPVARDRSIATIAVDPGDAQHLYIGTALARHGSSTSNGGRRTPPGAPPLGLYESKDGGASFGSAFSKPADSNLPETGNDFFTGGVNKIRLDPNDAHVVYAAVIGYGIWRRAGAGAFEQVFATQFPADSVDDNARADMFGDRTEFDVADLGAKTRMYVGDSSNDTATAVLWRTDDAGQPAANLVQPGTATANPTNRAPAYVQLSSSNIADPAGFSSYEYCQFGQCGYDNFVVADPQDPDTVYLGGAMNYDEIFGAEHVTPQRTNGRAVVRSQDAGVSFTDMTNENKPTVQDDPDAPATDLAVGMHPDQHALVFSPSNGAGTERVFVGSDGGVVRTSGAFADDSARCDQRQADKPADGQFTPQELALCKQALAAVPTGIDALNAGLSTLQFQSLSANPAHPEDVIGGTQDNGTWAFTGSPAWFESIGGDGGQSAIDPAAGTRVHTYFGPTTDVNFNGNDPKTWDYISQPLDDANFNCGTGDPRSECFSFYVPMIADPKVPGTLFTGGEYIWRTQDSGGDKEDLETHCRESAFAIGDGETVCGDWVRVGGAKGHIGTAANYIVAAERAPSDTGTLWVGRRRGGLFVSTNADAANATTVRFTPVDVASAPGRFVSSVYVDPADPDHAWVSYSGYEAYTPGQPGHVFDVRFNRAAGTATWTDLSGTTGQPGAIGDQPITDLVRDDALGDLYAGTDFGVLRRPNGASQWEKAAGNLPPVAVYGLAVSAGGRVLYAATHGRGAWRVALPPAPAPPPPPGPPPPPPPGPPPPAPPPPPPPPGVTPPPAGTPVPATRKPVIGRLSGRRSATRSVTVRIGLARTGSLTLSVRDQRGRTIGRRTVRIRRDDLFDFHVSVRPRAGVTARTRWRVVATARQGALVTAKAVRFGARR
jgi:hypothetical protein